MCGVAGLKDFLTLSQMPIYMGTTTTANPNEDVFVDQVWAECGSCGVVQLKHLGDLDLVYMDNHHKIEVGSTWNRHHSSFADFIQSEDGEEILELGPGAGYLASRLLSRADVKYTVVEPKPGAFPERVRVISGFVEDNYHLINASDTIVHSHLFEHLYFPRKFIEESCKHMKLGAKLFISVPNFEGLLESAGSVNVLNFEHTFFLHRSHLEQLLHHHGMRINEVALFEKHSFFVSATKVSEASENSAPELERLEGWADKLVDLWGEVEDLASTYARNADNFGGKQYLFGAHVFSQAFLNKVPLGSQFDGVLDNDVTKQGSRLYGTALQVFGPQILERTGEEKMVILMASHYQNEVREQLLSIHPNLLIIEPTRLLG